MTKFAHLQKLDVAQAKCWMDVPEISPGARLLLVPATEANPGYYNAMLRMSGRRARQAVRTEKIDAEHLAQNRADDRVLYPLHVIVGWEGVLDDQGNPVAWSREEAKDLCEQLPAWLFDRIRNHAATPERFLPEDEPEAPDAAELAGNSGVVSASS